MVSAALRLPAAYRSGTESGGEGGVERVEGLGGWGLRGWGGDESG